MSSQPAPHSPNCTSPAPILAAAAPTACRFPAGPDCITQQNPYLIRSSRGWKNWCGTNWLIRRHISPLLTSTLPRGIIHADFFPDNVFFNGTAVSGLIDFYFACSDAWAYDVAITLNAWCFEADGMLNRAKADTLLTHYQAIRPFSKEEHAAFPILLRGAALRFLLTRAYDWLNPAADATVIPKHPVEYLSKLRLHQRMGGV